MQKACKKPTLSTKNLKECKKDKKSKKCKEAEKKAKKHFKEAEKKWEKKSKKACKKATAKYKDQNKDLEKVMRPNNKYMIASKLRCAPSEAQAKAACANKILTQPLTAAQLLVLWIIIGIVVGCCCICLIAATVKYKLKKAARDIVTE